MSAEPTHGKLKSDCLKMLSPPSEPMYPRISAGDLADSTSSLVLFVGPPVVA